MIIQKGQEMMKTCEKYIKEREKCYLKTMSFVFQWMKATNPNLDYD